MRSIGAEFPKWQDWAERIKLDVQNRLVHPRQVFRGFVEIVNANAKHIGEHDGEVFVRFVQRCYASHTVMAIRSHSKIPKRADDSISLMRLLVQIRDCASQFTFQFFLDQFYLDPSPFDWRPGAFSLFSQDGKTVSRVIVEKDIDTLNNLTGKVTDLADRSFAHLDKQGFDGVVTFGDLDACIDAFDQLVCKYLTLIKGSGFASLEPTILDDWQKIFTVPLDIRPDGSRHKQSID
jgi:hypothetical protein